MQVQVQTSQSACELSKSATALLAGRATHKCVPTFVGVVAGLLRHLGRVVAWHSSKTKSTQEITPGDRNALDMSGGPDQGGASSGVASRRESVDDQMTLGTWDGSSAVFEASNTYIWSRIQIEYRKP